MKLARQVRQFGAGLSGMPPPQVTRGRDGLLMINDGVTRASRVAKLALGVRIWVEVIEDRPGISFEHLPRVRERL